MFLLIGDLTILNLGVQIERAFYLSEIGALTIEMLAAGSKVPKLSKTLNKSTGKESGYELAFSEAIWGDQTRHYRKQVDSSLRPSSMKIIITRSRAHYNNAKKKALKSLTDSQSMDAELGSRPAELIDISD
jgi:hypothetical protein